jgi:hypothetical protein
MPGRVKIGSPLAIPKYFDLSKLHGKTRSQGCIDVWSDRVRWQHENPQHLHFGGSPGRE